MRSHVVHFTAPINSHTCSQLIDKCSQAIQQGADELIIKIATMGGEYSYGFSLYNFLVSLPVPVKTHNLWHGGIHGQHHLPGRRAAHGLPVQQVPVPPLPLDPQRRASRTAGGNGLALDVTADEQGRVRLFLSLRADGVGLFRSQVRVGDRQVPVTQFIYP